METRSHIHLLLMLTMMKFNLPIVGHNLYQETIIMDLQTHQTNSNYMSKDTLKDITNYKGLIIMLMQADRQTV